jgi:lipopolysaccharide export system protein LptC
VTDATTDTLSMVNARYFGTDDKGEPFSVTAQGVKERPAPDKLIDLVEPRAQVATKDGRRVDLAATTGVYDRTNEILDLAGKVDLLQKDGYEIHTSQARVLLKENSASGTAAVTGKGPMGEIEGAGFTARQNDSVIIFTGPAKMILQKDKSADATPAPNAPPATPTPETHR